MCVVNNWFPVFLVSRSAAEINILAEALRPVIKKFSKKHWWNTLTFQSRKEDFTKEVVTYR